MGANKELFALVRLPEQSYHEIKHFEGVELISIYDKSMYKHFLENEQWQEANTEYKLAQEKKNQIELDIIYAERYR